MPPERSFSFENNYDGNQPSHDQTRYRDSPERHALNIATSPQQFPQQPLEEPVSPVSAYRPISHHSQTSTRHEPSFDAPRRSFVIGNNDIPPVPPPHQRNPSLETRRRPMPNATPNMDSTGSPYYNDGGHGGRGFRPSMEASTNDPYSRRPPPRPYDLDSSASGFPLAAGAATPGAATPHDFTPDAGSSHHSMRSMPQSYAMGPVDTFDDSPYLRSGMHSSQAVHDADILPYNIVDDGDDGFMPEPKRKSMLPLGGDRSRSREAMAKGGAVMNVGAGGGPGAGAGAGAAAGGFFGRKNKAVTSSGSYNAVSASDSAVPEKSEWLSRQTVGKRRMRWILGGVIGTVIVLAIIGGIVGGVLGAKNSPSGGGGNGSINNAATDTATNGDLGINSAEIQGLMNNKNLHKVFPGMDYTPWGVQYPLCLTYPPSQNNVTRDMALVSQLTNAVRLYGTDCNQTEMVLHAIDRLELKNMKVWLGVWIDTNATTTQRQLDQMYKILGEVKDHSIFAGVIIGNEALYRAGEDKAQSEQELIDILTQAKSNFTSLNYDLTISTSDLGDNWAGTLVSASHYVMSNVHPFFAGVDVGNAASWTWDFWQSHDVVLTNGDESRQVIAETGWPSGGGTDCGNPSNTCAAGQTGSVASVANMNTFMEDWVCQALANKTNYFWFSAFDEAWKVAYNTPGKEWEDKWGLMDTARNLKPGLKIPDCGGQTV